MAKKKTHRGESWQAMCRADAYGKPLKKGDKVSIRGGFFSGKPWKKSTPGIVTGWSGCGVAEVKVVSALESSYGRNAKFDVGSSDLTKRRR